MNRHEIRENLVFSVYQNLLLKKDLNSCVFDNFNLDSIEEADDYLKILIEDIVLNKTAYIEEIAPLLNKWTFDRLNYIDQAILLVGVSEIKIGRIDRAIAINEAINIAKEYSDDDSFKYINGVLDQIR